jgi:hypothetical protein
MNAILNTEAPKTRKEQRQFIGIVNYYLNMWFRKRNFLGPSTSLTSNMVKFEWQSSHQQAFDKIKKVIGTEMMYNSLLSMLRYDI